MSMFEHGFQTATAIAPATISNVAVGFDILGFSLTGLHDTITVSRTPEKGVHLVDLSGHYHTLPHDPARNAATAGLVALTHDRDLDFGLNVHINKGIPLHAGLGSAASSAVAAVVATSAVLDHGLSLPERFHYAQIGEEIASGSPHGDTIAPALLGGLILVRSLTPLDVIRIPVPHDMGAVIIRPHIEVDIRKSRALLHPSLSLQAHINQSANLAGFLSGCYSDDRDLIARSLQDLVIEPQRAPLIPHFQDVKDAALHAGAMGCSISGAGPTIFAFHDFHTDGHKIQQAMLQVFHNHDIEASGLLSPINGLGAHLIAHS